VLCTIFEAQGLRSVFRIPRKPSMPGHDGRRANSHCPLRSLIIYRSSARKRNGNGNRPRGTRKPTRPLPPRRKSLQKSPRHQQLRSSRLTSSPRLMRPPFSSFHRLSGRSMQPSSRRRATKHMATETFPRQLSSIRRPSSVSRTRFTTPTGLHATMRKVIGRRLSKIPQRLSPSTRSTSRPSTVVPTLTTTWASLVRRSWTIPLAASSMGSGMSKAHNRSSDC